MSSSPSQNNEAAADAFDHALGLETRSPAPNTFAFTAIREHRQRLQGNAFYQERYLEKKGLPSGTVHPAFREPGLISDLSRPLPNMNRLRKPRFRFSHPPPEPEPMPLNQPTGPAQPTNTSSERAPGQHMDTMLTDFMQIRAERPQPLELNTSPAPTPQPTYRSRVEERHEQRYRHSATYLHEQPVAFEPTRATPVPPPQGSTTPSPSKARKNRVQFTDPGPNEIHDFRPEDPSNERARRRRSLLSRLLGRHGTPKTPDSKNETTSQGESNVPPKALQVLGTPTQSTGATMSRSPSKTKAFLSRKKSEAAELLSSISPHKESRKIEISLDKHNGSPHHVRSQSQPGRMPGNARDDNDVSAASRSQSMNRVASSIPPTPPPKDILPPGERAEWLRDNPHAPGKRPPRPSTATGHRSGETARISHETRQAQPAQNEHALSMQTALSPAESKAPQTGRQSPYKRQEVVRKHNEHPQASTEETRRQERARQGHDRKDHARDLEMNFLGHRPPPTPQELVQMRRELDQAARNHQANLATLYEDAVRSHGIGQSGQGSSPELQTYHDSHEVQEENLASYSPSVYSRDTEVNRPSTAASNEDGEEHGAVQGNEADHQNQASRQNTSANLGSSAAAQATTISLTSSTDDRSSTLTSGRIPIGLSRFELPVRGHDLSPLDVIRLRDARNAVRVSPEINRERNRSSSLRNLHLPEQSPTFAGYGPTPTLKSKFSATTIDSDRSRHQSDQPSPLRPHRPHETEHQATASPGAPASTTLAQRREAITKLGSREFLTNPAVREAGARMLVTPHDEARPSNNSSPSSDSAVRTSSSSYRNFSLPTFHPANAGAPSRPSTPRFPVSVYGSSISGTVAPGTASSKSIRTNLANATTVADLRDIIEQQQNIITHNYNMMISLQAQVQHLQAASQMQRTINHPARRMHGPPPSRPPPPPPAREDHPSDDDMYS